MTDGNIGKVPACAAAAIIRHGDVAAVSRHAKELLSAAAG